MVRFWPDGSAGPESSCLEETYPAIIKSMASGGDHLTCEHQLGVQRHNMINMIDGDTYSSREAGTSITTSGRLALSSVHAGSKLVGNYS